MQVWVIIRRRVPRCQPSEPNTVKLCESFTLRRWSGRLSQTEQIESRNISEDEPGLGDYPRHAAAEMNFLRRNMRRVILRGPKCTQNWTSESSRGGFPPVLTVVIYTGLSRLLVCLAHPFAARVAGANEAKPARTAMIQRARQT